MRVRVCDCVKGGQLCIDNVMWVCWDLAAHRSRRQNMPIKIDIIRSIDAAHNATVKINIYLSEKNAPSLYHR